MRPKPDEWKFPHEMAKFRAYVPNWTKPVPSGHCDLSGGLAVVDGYGLDGDLETVRTDLRRFLSETGLANPDGKKLHLVRGKVEDVESYRIEVEADAVRIVSGDDAGIRRAVYRLEDRLLSSSSASLPIGSETRRSWLKTRFSRSFFAPVNRFPLYTDELMDDVDYYPDGFLDRIAHEGVNALWITVRLREVTSTSFTPAAPGTDRRIAKLRRVAAKLRRYGIGLWVFAIEPHAVKKGDAHFDPRTDPLFKAHPEWFRGPPDGSMYVMCPREEGVRKYLEETMADLFRRAPEIVGYVNISYGERSTTCLSRMLATPGNGQDALSRLKNTCPGCAAEPPWKMHEKVASSIIRGIRSVKPEGRYITWFYIPHTSPERHSWIYEVPKHLPDGVTMMFNFESGFEEDQLGKMRCGGDYWLVHPGPSEIYRKMAAAGCRGAKIQTGCAFELGTIPYIPIPGLLYRKYRSMHELGADTVMQCWLIGSSPGTQNTAAGELAFEDFSDGEEDFLRRLAAPVWGGHAEKVAGIWKAYSDAFANYPISCRFQYFSPFNEGVCWALHPDVDLEPLTPSWKPDFPPCGDTAGEALDAHTMEEALILTGRMKDLPDISDLPENTLERQREKGVLRAAALHCRSAYNALSFYRARAEAVACSRVRGEHEKALTHLGEMSRVIKEERLTALEMKRLSSEDDRLGYHAEAEMHRYFPAAFDWRIRRLDRAEKRIGEITAALSSGRAYPESERERTAERCAVGGEEIVSGKVSWRLAESDGEFRVLGRCRPGTPEVRVSLMNATSSEGPVHVALTPEGFKPYFWAGGVDGRVRIVRLEKTPDGGWSFELAVGDAEWGRNPVARPGWITVSSGKDRWPAGTKPSRLRLLLGPCGWCYGRIDYPPAR